MSETQTPPIVAMYADGGLIQSNPSPYGGLYAYRLVDAQGICRATGSGLILVPNSQKHPTRLLTEMAIEWTPISHLSHLVGNNQAEFVAFLKGLEALPDGWSGDVYSDSKNTLNGFFAGQKMKYVGHEWMQRLLAVKARLGCLTPHLLDGHPTREQLATGKGKRGGPVSIHNHLCDEECRRLSRAYFAAQTKTDPRNDKVQAPFTPEQIESLNAYQQWGGFHEFTCANDSRHRVLVATEAGWVCPDCPYTQQWAPTFMADNSWRQAQETLHNLLQANQQSREASP